MVKFYYSTTQVTQWISHHIFLHTNPISTQSFLWKEFGGDY